MENNKQNSKYEKIEYNNEYNKTHYQQIKFLAPIEKQFNERLKVLSIGTNKSKNQLLIEAVEMLLEKYNAWNYTTTNKTTDIRLLSVV